MESILRGQSRVNSSRGSTAIRQWARNYATSSPLPTDQPSLMLPKEIPFIPPCRFSKQEIIDRCIDKSINRPPVKRATRSAMKGTQDEGKIRRKRSRFLVESLQTPANRTFLPLSVMYLRFYLEYRGGEMSRFIVFGAKIVDSNNRYNCSNEFLDQDRIFQFVTRSENNDFRDSGAERKERVG